MNTNTPKPPTLTPTPGFACGYAVAGLPNSHTPIRKTMYRLATLTTLALTLFFTAQSSLAQEARFEGFSLDNYLDYAWRTSANGSVVVGAGVVASSTWRPFRWEAGVMEELNGIPDGHIQAYGVSADGSVVVGSDITNPSARHKAFRWENGEYEILSGCDHTKAIDTSDGSIIVGSCAEIAVRWVNGELEFLGVLPGQSSSEAIRITNDGHTIVGISSSREAGTRAFIWTEENGMVDLGIPGATRAYARGINSDGSVVVGEDQIEVDEVRAWRWKEDVGAEYLPLLPNETLGAAGGVSGDGSIIVGYSGGTLFEPEKAVIWTEDEAGMQVRDLQEVLEEEYGLDLTGWNLKIATDISEDGNVIIGSGINPEGVWIGWRVEAPFSQPVADEATPEVLADVLSAPSPNPVHGTSTFTIAVEQGQNVSVEVFDALGRHAQTVYDGALAAGMSETFTLDASALPAGVYIIRATGEDFVKSRNVTIVK